MRNEFERAVLILKSRRRQWQMRIGATVGTAVLIIVACWSAGIFDQWKLWFAPDVEISTAAQPKPPVMPTPPAATNARPLRRADEGAVGKLRLVATQPGRDARDGTAQLATGDADALTYVAGALLANGTSLVEVHADHVVLKRGNATTELHVDGSARSARASKASTPDEALITVSAPLTQPSRPVGPVTYSNLMRSAPRFIDNSIAGFEVYQGIDASALGRLNLQTSDVLLEIDGRVLKSVEQLHASLKSISSGGSLTATVLRGSEQLVVSMDGAALKESQLPSIAEVPR